MKTKMLILLMAVVLAGWFAGCAQEEGPSGTPTPEETSTPTVTDTPCPTPTPSEELCPEGAQAGEIDCSQCHDNSEKYQPHVNGGDYCFDCHGSDPHTIHTGEGTIQLECSVCHGGGTQFKTGKQFQQEAGNDTTCVLCHSPEDPTKPTDPRGNLVTIHLGRDQSCSTCHAESLDVLHASADPTGG